MENHDESYLNNNEYAPETPQSDQTPPTVVPPATTYRRRSIAHIYNKQGKIKAKERVTLYLSPTTKNFIFLAIVFFSFLTIVFAMGMIIYSAINDQCVDTYMALITLVLGIFTPQPSFETPSKKNLKSRV